MSVVDINRLIDNEQPTKAMRVRRELRAGEEVCFDEHERRRNRADATAYEREAVCPVFVKPTTGSVTAYDATNPTHATAPLPDWMLDPSLLPKRPPGAK